MYFRPNKRLLCLLLILGLALASAGLGEELESGDPLIVEAAELGEMDLDAPEIRDAEVPAAEPAAAEPEAFEPAAEPEAPAEPEPATAEPALEPVVVEPTTEPPVENPEEAAGENPGEYAVAAPEPFQTSVTLGVKERTSLNGLALSGGQPVSYVSSKPKVASVDENGLVLARKKGKAVITVYLGEAALGACEVTVLKAPGKVKFPEKSIVLSKDQARSFLASLPKGTAGTISYTSDNPGVLGVDAYGNLYGVSGGTATLTATAYNGKKATCAVRVLGGPAPTWVALNQESTMLPVKSTFQLAASFDEGCDAVMTYATSNKKIATVSADGLIKAKKAGQAVITATTHNGLTATCAVQVYILPKKVTLNTKKLKMYPNEGFQLTAAITKNSVSEIAWSSDNPGVATVDGNGLVAAVGIGQATIIAQTSNGKKAKCKVTVKAAPAVQAGIRGDVVFHDESDTLRVTISYDKGVYLTYIWAQSPVRQLFKAYGHAKPGDILQGAVNAGQLRDKIVVGFNASPPVNEVYRPDWNEDPNYRYREPSPLMIANGQVLVNDPEKTIDGKFLYWLDGNSQLRYSAKPLEDMTVEERRALYSEVIASGARNTMVWQPVLVIDHRATKLSSSFVKSHDGKQKKQALCQMDDGGFLLVSSGSGSMTYPSFQKYLVGLGCKTAVEFDAGGSTALFWKPKGTDAVQTVTGGGRELTMVMYLTEG